MAYSPCNICGSLDYDKIRDYPGFKNVDLVTCLSCGLMQAQPVPSDEFLMNYYSSTFGSASGKDVEKPSTNGRSVAPEKEFEMSDASEKGFRLRAILQYDFVKKNRQALGPKGRILDVGCHAASFLSLFKDRGWDVVGLDPNPRSAYGQKWYGIDVIQKLFSPGLFPAGSFDAIIHSHALEHVPDPRTTLEEFYCLLKPGGWVFLEVPNESHAKVASQRVIPHLYFFTPDTLTKLCVKAGFRVVNTKVLGVTSLKKPLFSAEGLRWMGLRARASYDALGRWNPLTSMPFFGKIIREDRYFKGYDPQAEMLRTLLEKPV